MKSKLRLILTISLFMVFMLAACDGGDGSKDPTSTVVEPAAISSPVSESTATSEAAGEEGDAAVEEGDAAEESADDDEIIDY